MLILTRRPGESLIINENINVTVLGIKGNQVRVGIKAPKDVPVHREEIQEKIDGEKQEKKVNKVRTIINDNNEESSHEK